MSKLIIVLLSFFITHQSDKKESDYINKEILIPENLELIYGSDNNENINNIKNHLSIIVYVNGNCYSCIQDLNNWMEYINKNHFSKEINFIFFTDIFDVDRFVNIVKSSTSFEYPIYNDRAQLFWKLNNIPLGNKINTFLIYEGFIQDVGHPTHSSDDLSRFNSKINHLLE